MVWSQTDAKPLDEPLETQFTDTYVGKDTFNWYELSLIPALILIWTKFNTHTLLGMLLHIHAGIQVNLC